MPENPLEMLRRLAMRNVPKPTDTQRENWDFRAQAIQDAEPDGFKRLGRQVVDFVGGLLEDPFTDSPSVAKGITPRSTAFKSGALMAAAPFGVPKRLPIIAPEAYDHVKAGGLRLYSRLTDAFAKAPKVMHPQKARSVAAQGASKEEINLRKLEEFLSGQQPGAKIERQAVMDHLAANPLELDVVRKGRNNSTTVDDALGRSQEAQRQLDQFVHELETRYGRNWQGPRVEPNPAGMEGVSTTPEEWQRYTELEDAVNRARNDLDYRADDSVKYDWMQTPGPKENYGETLINLPYKDPWKKELAQSINSGAGAMEPVRAEMVRRGLPLDNGDYPASYASLVKELQDETFQSSHWNEPNNLVWSRYNDRYLNPETPYGPARDSAGPPQGKGRLVEEIQSDWHQQGREAGYRGDPVDIIVERTGAPEGHNEAYFGRTADVSQGNPISYSSTEEGARHATENYVNSRRPPQAPFKDTYHELALKEQLLDAANQPDLEWLGVADADTASVMEGHIPHLGSREGFRPGMEKFYNERHPAALEKLLSPLGGKVEYATINNESPLGSSRQLRYEHPSPGHDLAQGQGTLNYYSALDNKPNPVVTSVTGDPIETIDPVRRRLAVGGQVPGPGMWKANLTPELKALIRERGFPAMIALLSLMQLNNAEHEQ